MKRFKYYTQLPIILTLVFMAIPINKIQAAIPLLQETQDPGYEIETLDILLNITGDGTLTFRESQQIIVKEGTLDTLHHNISKLYVDTITNLSVWEVTEQFTLNEEECHHCYWVEEEQSNTYWVHYNETEQALKINDLLAGRVKVRFHFDPLAPGDSATFYLLYQAIGAIKVLDNGQLQTRWTVVSPYKTTPVKTTHIHLVLSEELADEELNIEADDGKITQVSDTEVLITYERLEANEGREITLTFPAGSMAITKPIWQQQLEAAAAEGKVIAARRSRLQAAIIAAAVGILALGTIALLINNNAQKKQPQDNETLQEEIYIEPLIDIPPGDFPPGLLAHLLYGKITPKGTLATLFQLADLDLISIRFSPSGLTIKKRKGHDQPAEFLQGQSDQMADDDYRKILYNAIEPILAPGKPVPFEAIEPAFQEALPRIYAAMSEEAKTLSTLLSHVFVRKARQPWKWLLLAAIPLTVVLAIYFSTQISFWIAATPLWAVLSLIVIFSLFASTQEQPQIDIWEMQKHRWQSYQDYLQNLSPENTITFELQQIINLYFTYVLALGADKNILRNAQTSGLKLLNWTIGSETTIQHIAKALNDTSSRIAEWPEIKNQELKLHYQEEFPCGELHQR